MTAIRATIQAQAQSYKLYINSILEHYQLKGLIDLVASQMAIFVFSGITRNFLLGYLNNRDIDFVVLDSSKLRIPLSQIRNFTILKNKFGGYKLQVGNLTIDVWDVHKTWGILQESMRGTAYSLMNTAFFNFSAIVFDYNKGMFYISDEFCEFYKTHVMEVVYAKNPRVETCIVNALYYADNYGFTIGESLRRWIVKHYTKELNFEKAQQSRLQKVVYSNEMINAFAVICSRADIYSKGTVRLGREGQEVELKFGKIMPND